MIILSPSVKVNCQLWTLVTVPPDHVVTSVCRINEGHMTHYPSLSASTRNDHSGKYSAFQVNPALSHCVCRAQEGCVKKGKEPGIKAVEYRSKSKLWAAVDCNNRDWGEQHLSMTDLQCLSFCSISKRKNLSFNTHQLLTCYWYSSCGALCIADGVVTLSRKPRALGEEHGQVLCFSLFGSAGRVRSLRQSWSKQELKSLCWRNWWTFAWSQKSFMLSGMV